MKILFLFAIFCSQLAYSQKQCSAFDLTKDCREFDSLPSPVVLPDGTSFPNPRVAEQSFPNENANDSKSKYNKDYATAMERQLDAQAKFFEETRDQKDFSEKFKIAFVNSFQIKLKINSQKKIVLDFDQLSSEQLSMINFYLPWPPNEKNAKLKQINVVEVLGFLNTIKDETTKNAIVSLTSATAFGGFGVTTIDQNQKDKPQGVKHTTGFSVKPKDMQIKVTEERKNHLQQLVEQAKVSIVNALKAQGKKTGTINESEELAKKIIAIKMIEPTSEYIKNNCAAGPNAHYLSSNNSFSFCPSLMNFPDSQLMFIIGHELGHAIDPCRCSAGLHNIDKSMKESILMKPNFEEMSSHDFRSMVSLRDVEITGIEPSFSFTESFNKYAKKLNLFTEVAKGIDPLKHPFHSVRSCLVKGSNLREIKTSQIPEIVDQIIFERRKTIGIVTADSEKVQMEKSLKMRPDCISAFGKNTEVNEAMSDFYGSIAQANFLEKFPPKNSVERLAAQSYWLRNMCNDTTFISSKVPESAPEYLALEIQARAEDRLGPHPRPLLRIDQMIFSNPKLAKIFNCEPTINAKCFESLYSEMETQGSKQKSELSAADGVKK